MNAKTKGRNLPDATVTLTRIYQKTTVHNIILSWRVPDYEDLSYDVMHFQIYESLDIKCVFRLFRQKETLHLSVSSDCIPQNTVAEFLILNEANLETVTTKAEKIEDGIFMGKFANDQFSSTDCKFLANGTLTVAFKYASDFYTTYKEDELGEAEVLADLDELCCDLKNMYLDSVYCDYVIHVRDFSFKCHRFILAARSEYFNQVVDADKDEKEHTLHDDVVPGIMHEVLLYMYSGELKEMDVECMLHVFRLAVDLLITGLVERCQDYFDKKIDEGNCVDICRYSVKFNLRELKNTLIRVVKRDIPHINIIDLFKKFGEDMADDDSTINPAADDKEK